LSLELEHGVSEGREGIDDDVSRLGKDVGELRRMVVGEDPGEKATREVRRELEWREGGEGGEARRSSSPRGSPGVWGSDDS